MCKYDPPKQFAYIDPAGKFQRLGTPIESTEHLQKCLESIPNKAKYLSVYGWADWKGGQITPEISKTALVDGVFFDFDDAADPERALMDAAEVAQYVGHCTCNFSGSKGAHVLIKCPTANLVPDLKGAVLRGFANMLCDVLPELDTMDSAVIGDTSRVSRVIDSVHPKTKLHAIGLSAEELAMLSIDEVREMAKNPRRLVQVPEPSRWVTDELYRIEAEILSERLTRLHDKEQISGENYRWIIAILQSPDADRIEIFEFITQLENMWRKVRAKKFVDLSGEIIGSSREETWLIHAVREFKATGRAATGSRKSEHKARVHLAKLANECGWTISEICEIFIGADDYDPVITERMIRSCIR